MKNIAVFYGGKSSEHDISIITAVGLMGAIDKTKYKLYPIYIDLAGNWHYVKNYMNIHSYIKPKYRFDFSVGFFNRYILKRGCFGFKKYAQIDVCINCCHGINGEDGTLAGLIKLANIPLVGSGTLASSVGMDKTIMKDVFVKNNIPCVKYVYFTETDLQSNYNGVISKIEDTLMYPIITKPANLGSSIGINISKNRKELEKNIKIALKFDKKVIFEEVLPNLREINCSVIGNYKNCVASILEEPINWKTFLNFDEKYILSGNNKKRVDVHISADVDKKILDLSMQCFKLLGCSGVTRIDFLLNDKTKEVFVNEINTIPGSYANYLWKNSFEYGKLLDTLIEYAEDEYRYYNSCQFAFCSNVLKNYSGNKMAKKIKI